MKNKTILVMVSTLIIVSSSLVSCGGDGDTTLEGYVEKNPDVQERIEKSLSSMGTDEMTVEVSFDGNEIVLVGKLDTAYSNDIRKAIEKSMDKNDAEFDKAFKGAIEQIEGYSKIPGITIKLVMLDGNDEVVWSKDYAD